MTLKLDYLITVAACHTQNYGSSHAMHPRFPALMGCLHDPANVQH